jgi:hypothetical protein
VPYDNYEKLKVENAKLIEILHSRIKALEIALDCIEKLPPPERKECVTRIERVLRTIKYEPE